VLNYMGSGGKVFGLHNFVIKKKENPTQGLQHSKHFKMNNIRLRSHTWGVASIMWRVQPNIFLLHTDQQNIITSPLCE